MKDWYIVCSVNVKAAHSKFLQNIQTCIKIVEETFFHELSGICNVSFVVKNYFLSYTTLINCTYSAFSLCPNPMHL